MSHLLSLVSTILLTNHCLIFLSYPLVNIFIRKWKTSVIIRKNCVQLLKPTQFPFLAFPLLKNKQYQVPLAKPLSQSPAAILPAICSPRCSAWPLLLSQPHMHPFVAKWGAHWAQQPSALQHHLLPTLSIFWASLLTQIPQPVPPGPCLLAPANPMISRDRMLTGKDGGVAMEMWINIS
jgi:hypothetical protein